MTIEEQNLKDFYTEILIQRMNSEDWQYILEKHEREGMNNQAMLNEYNEFNTSLSRLEGMMLALNVLGLRESYNQWNEDNKYQIELTMKHAQMRRESGLITMSARV